MERLTQIAAVIAMLRNGQIASFEAAQQVLDILQRDCEITDPTPHFTQDERNLIAWSNCPLLVAGLLEVLPGHFPNVDVKVSLEATLAGYVN